MPFSAVSSSYAYAKGFFFHFCFALLSMLNFTQALCRTNNLALYLDDQSLRQIRCDTRQRTLRGGNIHHLREQLRPSCVERLLKGPICLLFLTDQLQIQQVTERRFSLHTVRIESINSASSPLGKAVDIKCFLYNIFPCE